MAGRGHLAQRSAPCTELALLRPVLQGPLHQCHSFGEPACLTPLIPLVQGEAGGLLTTTDAGDVAHERQGGSLRGVRTDQAAGLPTAQLEHHAEGSLHSSGLYSHASSTTTRHVRD